MKMRLLDLDITPDQSKTGKDRRPDDIGDKDIAIIGIGVKLPMAANVHAFWDNIVNTSDCTRELPKDRKADANRYMARKVGSLDGVRYLRGAYLDGIDKFDYPFFRFSPKEASLMNPAQRLFMETAWSAIEDAGYGGGRIVGSNTGVFVGLVSDLEGYRYREMIHDVEPEALPISVTGNLSCILSSRISYLLDLRGPSIVVDTACSSSLVAVHNACNSIRSGECDMAIAGGVKLHVLPLDQDYLKMGIESSDGVTRAFADSGDGSGIGEGAAAVMLKPLKHAIRDRDQIYAVVKGSAINQDGNSMGITAPNARAQSEVIVKAWRSAGIDPETIGYMETHGTATKLGDPIEVDGIAGAFERFTDKKQFVAIGSVKSNIGHLFECAGIASLIKAVMALKHRTLPPTMHFDRPNRNIDFSSAPVYVNRRAREWESGDGPRRCGVSAFGLSGTNCHVILEEAPAPQPREAEEEQVLHVLTVSAKSEQALQAYIERYIAYLERADTADVRLSDICFTANACRDAWPFRLAVLASDKEQLADRLRIARVGQVMDNGLDWLFRGTVITKREEADEDGAEWARAYRIGGKRDAELLRKLCECYVSGGEVHWHELYRDDEPMQTSVPTYPFEPHRCWIELQDAETANNERDRLLKGQTVAHCHYGMSWKQEPLSANGQRTTKIGPVAIFMDGGGIGEGLAGVLRAQGRTVFEIRPGDRFEATGEGQYTVGGDEREYDLLIAALQKAWPEQIVHAETLVPGAGDLPVGGLDAVLERGFMRLFFLVRAIGRTGGGRALELILVTDHVTEVTGREPVLKPHNAPLLGLGKIIGKELSELSCRCIDVDALATPELIAAELGAGSRRYEIVYREGIRYTNEFGPIELRGLPEATIDWKEDGVYVITGGLGGIGLELAKRWANARPIRLALINRTPLPLRESWTSVLEVGADPVTCRKIKAILEIEASGVTVAAYAADVSDRSAMERVLAEIREAHGPIRGIIHGAGIGIGGDKTIADRRLDELQAVMRPKIQGTFILDELTREDDPDFFVLFSSIATSFGAAGQGDYIAANGYLDAYAAYRNRMAGHTMTVNWSTWRETGAAAATGYGIDTMFKAMGTEEALELLDEAMSKKMSNVLIGTVNVESGIAALMRTYPFRLAEILDRMIAPATKGVAPQVRRPLEATAASAVLSGSDDGRYTDIEITIAAVCKAVLGFDSYDIHESFFELGADSILLKQMYVQLDKCYPGTLIIADLFEHPTIRRLGLYIAVRTGAEAAAAVEETSVPHIGADIGDEVKQLLDGMERGTLSLEDVLNGIKSI